MLAGVEVERQNQLPYMVASHMPGSEVEVEVLRKGETLIDTALNLEAMQADVPGDRDGATGGGPPAKR